MRRGGGGLCGMLAGFFYGFGRVSACVGGAGAVDGSFLAALAADFAETCICFVAARPPPLPLPLFFCGNVCMGVFCGGGVSVSSAFRPPPSRRVAPPVGLDSPAMFHVEHFFAFIRSGWREVCSIYNRGSVRIALGCFPWRLFGLRHSSAARRKKFLRRSPKRRKFRKCLI